MQQPQNQNKDQYMELMKGPIEQRSCKDIPWLILYLLGFVAFVIVFAVEAGVLKDYYKGKIPAEVMKELTKDISAWFIAIGIPLAIGFVFLLLTPYMAGCVIWTILIVKILLFAVLGVVIMIVVKGTGGIFLGGIFFVIALVYAGLTYCLRNEIRIGIILIKAAGTYFLQNLYIIVVPLVAVFIYSGFLIMAFFCRQYTITVKSLGEYNPKYKSKADVAKIFEIYEIFYFYWTSYVFYGICVLGVAVSVCMWYFQQDLGANLRPIDNKFFKSLVWPLTYHIGSISLGAFILAVMDTIQLFIDYQNAKKSRNPLMKLFGCICAKCIECIKHLNKISLIMIAMTGASFCESAMKGFKLVSQHLVQYVVLQKIKNLYINSGGIVIILLSAFLSIFIYLEKTKDDDKWGRKSVTILILILICFAITYLVLSILSTAADSCLFCLTVDKQVNGCPKKGPRIMAEVDKDNQTKPLLNRAPGQQDIAMTSMSSQSNDTFVINQSQGHYPQNNIMMPQQQQFSQNIHYQQPYPNQLPQNQMQMPYGGQMHNQQFSNQMMRK